MGKSLSEIRNSKPFYSFDIIIYCTLALIIAVTVFALFFTGKNSENLGAYILFDNQTAAEYRFDGNSFTVKSGFDGHFLIASEGIYFYPDENSHENYNLIITNAENKTVYIKHATCTGHDCENQKITENGGFIYCAPHKLKIVPIKMTNPVSG